MAINILCYTAGNVSCFVNNKRSFVTSLSHSHEKYIIVKISLNNSLPKVIIV